MRDHCDSFETNSPFFSEHKTKPAKKIIDSFLKVLIRKQLLEENFIKAVAIVIDRKTKEMTQGFRIHWILNGKKIGHGMFLKKKNFIEDGETKYKLRVVASLKNTGALVKTITIIAKKGKKHKTILRKMRRFKLF